MDCAAKMHTQPHCVLLFTVTEVIQNPKLLERVGAKFQSWLTRFLQPA